MGASKGKVDEMTELQSLMERKRELTWSMLLHTPKSFATPGAHRERRELGQVAARMKAIVGEA